MEMLIAILSFLLHCFTAFALVYANDEAKIYGDADADEIQKLKMPKLNDVQEEEMLIFCEDDTEEERERKIRTNDYTIRKNKELRQEFVDTKIKYAFLYFPLLDEIKHYQSEYRSGFSNFLIQLFSLLLCSQMFIRMDLLESVIGTILIVALTCMVATTIIYLIYTKYWRCHKIRMKHYSYSEYNYSIYSHYDYLISIKETVYFRYSIRKILNGFSLIILILFMPIPEY